MDQTCAGQGLLVPPLFPVLLGSLRVLREVEMAWAICDDVVVDVEESIIVWTLPVSKTDLKAKSCKRKWECLCAHLCEALCPFHVFVKYLSALQAVSGRGCIKNGSYPVFPDPDGKVVVKVAPLMNGIILSDCLAS